MLPFICIILDIKYLKYNTIFKKLQLLTYISYYIQQIKVPYVQIITYLSIHQVLSKPVHD